MRISLDMSNKLVQSEVSPQTVEAVIRALQATQGRFSNQAARLTADFNHVYDPGIGMNTVNAKVSAAAISSSGAIFETDKFQVNDVYNTTVGTSVKIAEQDYGSGRGDGSVLVSRTKDGKTKTRLITGERAEKLTEQIMHRVVQDVTVEKPDK